MGGNVWEPVQHHPQAVAGEIHVWRIDLASQDLTASGDKILSADELTRARRLCFAQHRNRFIAGRAALRRLLGNYLATAAADLRFQYGPKGKPCLDPARHGHTIQFNFSNSNDLGLLAVTTGREVGIDIEYRERNISVEPLARHIFTASEAAAFRRLPPARQQQELLAVWTRKEAYVKALGKGFSLPLNSFSVAIAPETDATLRQLDNARGEQQSWKFLTLAAHRDYLASLTAPGVDWTLGCFDWRPDTASG
jgi:4'-phosphopantetheinyl transferase